MKKNIASIILFVCIVNVVKGQVISTFAGSGSSVSGGDGGSAIAAGIYHPSGIYTDRHGNIFIAEYGSNVIRKVDPTGMITRYAGNGFAGYTGDGGQATDASLYIPIDMVIDTSDNMYFVDNGNDVIRKISNTGIITTFAGTGALGYSGDGGLAVHATLHWPDRVGIDNFGNIYIADAGNNVVRKVDASGIITTVAGNGSVGFSGDGGPATAATLNTTLGVAFDANNNMYIADGGNNRVRKVDPWGIITTFAGNGAAASTGDLGMATAASMNYPGGVAVDRSCNVYVTEWYGQRVRRIETNGRITTVVGTGVAGFSGDGSAAVSAEINGPDNLTFDVYLNLYIPDYYNNRIRKVANLGMDGFCPVTEVHSIFDG